MRVDPVGWGAQTAIAAYSLITKQHLPLPKIIVRPAELVTKANAGKVASWKAQVQAIHYGTGPRRRFFALRACTNASGACTRSAAPT